MLYPNLPTRTLGGEIFWETLLQQNIFTEHYRIVDPELIRQAWSRDLDVIQKTFRKFTHQNLINQKSNE